MSATQYTEEQISYLKTVRKEVEKIPLSKVCKCEDKQWVQFDLGIALCTNCEVKWKTKAKYFFDLPSFAEVALPHMPKAEEKKKPDWPKGWTRADRRKFTVAHKKAFKKGLRPKTQKYNDFMRTRGFTFNSDIKKPV